VSGEWTITPVSDALVLLTALAYLNAHRRHRGWCGERWPAWRTVCMLSGLVGIVLALNSAIGVYSRDLHSVHMIQHLALITVAPALLALGHPPTLVRESSAHGREALDLVRHNRVVKVVTHPLVAFACYAAVLVGTHLTEFLTLVPIHPWLHQQGRISVAEVSRPAAQEQKIIAVKLAVLASLTVIHSATCTVCSARAGTC
jgi:cytochrome c oxidase assembly factor CtaG